MVSPAISDYMKIRRHVISLVYRSGDSPEQLPTIQDLCRKFDVSRPTVCKAMKELTGQGYVIARKGIGSFTNPARQSAGTRKLPLAGLLLGDGMIVYLGRYYGEILGETIKQLTAIPVTVQQLSLGSVVPETIRKEILDEKLDFLVWIGGTEVCVGALRAAGLPVIAPLASGEAKFPGSLQFDYEEWGYECGRLLLAEDRKNIIFLQYSENAHLYAGIRRAYEEAKVPINPMFIFDDSLRALSELKKIIRYGAPIDAVCNPLLGNNELTDILVEADPGIVKRCVIVQCSMSSPNPYGFREICFDVPVESLVNETVKMLKDVIENNGEYQCVRLKLNTIIR